MKQLSEELQKELIKKKEKENWDLFDIMQWMRSELGHSVSLNHLLFAFSRRPEWLGQEEIVILEKWLKGGKL